MKNWEWRFGRTPKFNITIKLNEKYFIVLTVKNGIIVSGSTTCNANLNKYINEKFDMKIVKEIQELLKIIKI